MLLVVLLLLNILGYYGVFLGLLYQNNKEMMARFDADEYATSETVTINVSLTLPYPTESSEYERVNGQFEYQGEFYRLVKQRLHHDTLSIVCIRDQERKNIHQALGNYVKTFTDKPLANSSGAKVFPPLGKDYLSSAISLSPSANGWSQIVIKNSSLCTFIPTFTPSIDPPPDRPCAA